MTSRSGINDRSSKITALCAAGSAYLVWGVVGLYFHHVTDFVEPRTLLAHRIIWSLVFVSSILFFRGDLRMMFLALRDRRLAVGLLITCVLIAINWIVFIEASHRGQLVAASLGYFLTPLMNVLLGVVVLGERLRPIQIISLLFAAAGVGWLIYHDSNDLWIAAALMLSFGFYGLLRKRLKVGPIVGLGVETLLLLPVAIGYIAIAPHYGAPLPPAGAYWLLVAAGVITAIPLILFAYAVPRVQLSTMGILQFISPSVQFLVATLILREQFSSNRLVSFAMIWLGLVLFSIDSYRAFRARSLVDRLPA